MDELNKKSRVVLDVLGPTVEFLVLPSEDDARYCVLKGTIPPGVSVPLHSHPDDESFLLASGRVHALQERKDGFEWTNMNMGDFRHVSQGVRHAWKNQSNEPAIAIIVTTARLGRFFQEIGRPVVAGTNPEPPSLVDVQRFAKVAACYNHWLASPEENAAVGIKLFQ
ncbi:MAG: cupin domain-containing protein [Verrucomicrobia bacterium]|nr:cupin domain-containing protein [Verrucomicrobiota bacterium]